VLHIVDNQWAISTHRDQATGSATFAARADAYRLPGLRVDGNDFLAVFAAESWAIERARRGGGPTLIEHVTYRQESHSTSDDPTQYRACEEGERWPGGDPIDRLKQFLILQDQWSESAHDDLNRALEREAATTFQQAESYGTAAAGHGLTLETLFDDVYETVPFHLQSQLQELRGETGEQPLDQTILPFANHHRVAG
jgi:2-oxoisovalerate dehydrogenase E1 component alpha subunit